MKGNITWQKDILDWPHTLTCLDIDPRKTALVIVDISNHSPEPTLKVMPNIIELRNFFRENALEIVYILSGCFLPSGRDQHIKRRLTSLRTSAAAPPRFHPKGSWGHEPREDLKPSARELVVDKNCRSAFSSPATDQYLRAAEIQNLVICGIATSQCVETTAREAADRGYNVVLVEDACGDTLPENHRASIRTFSRVLGSVKSTSEVIADFSALLAPKHLTASEVK
ncbi:MAG: cysteine hydrolase [Chloroflexi bacterium]|nr:cysteine hydrolase [Chloroflexota bacterium]